MNNLNVLTNGYCMGIRNLSYNIKQFFRNIKYAYQRTTKGYCDIDLWSLDNYYSELFYQTLKEFALKTHSYPGFDDFESTEENDGFENWQCYLLEMAEHFLNTQEWNTDVPINKEVSELFDKMNSYILDSNFELCEDGSYKLVNSYVDKKAYTKAKKEWLSRKRAADKFRESEKNKAFDMLKKYFFDLWD